MASGFLERENELLGGAFSQTTGNNPASNADELDLDRAASAFPEINLDGDIPVPQAPQRSTTNEGFGFDLGGLASQPTQREVKVTGDDELDKFESAFPAIGTNQEPSYSLPPPQGSVSFSTPSFAPRPQPSAGFSTPILQGTIEDEEEPEVIKKWREEQAEAIRKRDEESAQKRKDTIAQAERSIDAFYEEYNAKKARNIQENKIAEAAYLNSLRDSLSSGTTWSRICDLIELQNSQSKTVASTGPGTPDLARYREVLLRLKREGASAPGAGGY